jgi:predicted alpha/beta-hydrolase family hydrolase
MTAKPIQISLTDHKTVSGLLQVPRRASASYVLAHGAGAGMAHPFMTAVADGLADRGIATLRFQFPYMERGSSVPDRPHLAQRQSGPPCRPRRTWSRASLAGGKSFGGRMTSQAQAEASLPGVTGLILLGFPLHAIGNPSNERAAHLSKVGIPMLFLQGSRDALAEIPILTQ